MELLNNSSLWLCFFHLENILSRFDNGDNRKPCSTAFVGTGWSTVSFSTDNAHTTKAHYKEGKWDTWYLVRCHGASSYVICEPLWPSWRVFWIVALASFICDCRKMAQEKNILLPIVLYWNFERVIPFTLYRDGWQLHLKFIRPLWMIYSKSSTEGSVPFIRLYIVKLAQHFGKLAQQILWKWVKRYQT